MLSYPSPSFSQNFYSPDSYGKGTSVSFDTIATNQEDTFDQFFGFKENFFENFLIEYNHDREFERECNLDRNLHYCTSADENSICAASNFGESEISHMSSNGTESKYPLEKKIFFNHEDLKKTPIKQSIISENYYYSQASLSDFLDDDRTIIDSQDEQASLNSPVFTKIDLKLPASKPPLKLKLKRKISKENVTLRKNYRYSNRHRFKQSQIDFLEKEFQMEQYPNGVQIDRISNELGVSFHTVTVWFQNRRARFKKSYDKKNQS